MEVIGDPLYYNLLLGCSFMYTMKVIYSSIYCTMSFPHNGKIVTIDPLTYYDPKFQVHSYNVISSMVGNHTMPSLIEISPRVYKDSSLLGSYYVPPLLVTAPSTSQVCMVFWSQLLSSLVPPSNNQLLSILLS